MKRSYSPASSVCVLIAAAVFCISSNGVGGEAPAASEAAKPAAVEAMLSELKAQIKELDASRSELTEQVKRSVEEVQKLRQEISAAHDELMAIRQALADPARTSAYVENSQGPAARPAKAAASDPGSPVESAAAPQATNRQRNVIDLVPSGVGDDQELIAAKLDDLYQTKVESGSKYRVRLNGLALLNIFGTRGQVDQLNVPARAVLPAPSDSSGSFSAGVQQSLLGLDVFGPTVGGAKTSGTIQFDFSGGLASVSNGATESVARLRIAKMNFDWTDTSVVAGQDAPFFSPLSPSSLASIAYPAFAASGNMWTWTPQVRVEHRYALSEDSKLLFQAGILSPLTGEIPNDTFYRSAQAGERAMGPAYAARAASSRSIYGNPATVGVGFYFARQDWGFGRIVDAWAGTADWDIPLGRWFSLSGEFYRGQALGGLGAGAANSVIYGGSPSSPSTPVRAVLSAGGWTQFKYKPLERLEFNTAFGEDYPFASGLRGLSTRSWRRTA